MTQPHVDLNYNEQGSGDACASVLASLPEWFGIPEANTDFAAVADREPTVVATLSGTTVGVLTTLDHSSAAAEIYVMAVRRDLHRRGIGVAMLDATEQRLVGRGIRFLQVKTLADSDPDLGYARTRRFYRSQGFVTLEVFPTLWDLENPALQMIKLLNPNR